MVYFDKYVVDMTDAECREFITQLIEKVEVYDERQPDGKWIKDIKFKIPMINNETLFGLDNLNQLETVALLSKLDSAENHVEFELSGDELDVTAAENKATYQQIKDWVQKECGLSISSLNIAQVKRAHGIIERENYNEARSEDSRQAGCPDDKWKAIEAALKFFQMI